MAKYHVVIRELSNKAYNNISNLTEKIFELYGDNAMLFIFVSLDSHLIKVSNEGRLEK